MNWAKDAMEEAAQREAALWQPLTVRLTPAQAAWFAEHPEEHEQFRHRRPGQFDALAEVEDLMGVSIVPIGGGLARVYPEARWRFSDE